MKRGNAGLTGCCGGFGLWIVSINCPNPLPTEHSFPENDPGGTNAHTPADSEITSRGLAYAGRPWTNEFSLSVHKDVLPEIWPNGVGGVLSWQAYAAKGPTSYPGVECEKYPDISSAEDGGTGEWQSPLGVIFETEIYTPPAGVERIGTPKGFGFVYRSRAIYTDGEQTQLAYCMTGRKPQTLSSDGISGHFHLPNPPRSTGWLFGDTIIIDIANPGTPVPYATDTLNGIIFDPAGDTHDSLMEGQYSGIAMGNVFPDNSELDQYPCFQTSYGKRYAVFSTYSPKTFDFGGGSGYQVVRIKYDGTRRDDDDVEVDHVPEVFSTYSGAHGNPGPDLGKSGTSYDGTYIVVLPSVRCYLDSSVDSDDSPDEPYVVAINKDFSSTKIICAPWKSKIYRSGVGDETDFSGLADGTLSSSEVAVSETIMDESAPPDGYESEVFDNPRVWCYNRVWDSVEKKNVNLLLITTEPDDEPVTTADDIVADFEQGVFDPDYLNHNLDTNGLTFRTGGGNSGDKWMADAAEHHGGSYAARTNEGDVTKEGHIDLSLTINVANDGNLVFWYKLDNRKYGSRVEPFGELTNFAEQDNNLQIFVDGLLVPINIDGTDFSSSLIDNVNTPDLYDEETPYITWHEATIALAAGTHTIRWTLTRKWQDNGHLVAWLDDIALPEIMIGDDIDGLTRWYFDGYQLRKLTGNWGWAARDEEDALAITSRAQTVPHFITMDGAGRILIGNPHYIVRLNRDGALDETHGKSRGPGFDQNTGFVRFTASPNTVTPTPSCLDPNNLAAPVDTVSDPPHGAFQILPVGEDTYQVRGVNGDLDRDTTNFPFDKELWTYKHPQSGKVNQEIFLNVCRSQQTIFKPALWNERVHSWTISDDGHTLTPHVEVLWRPTMHQPAYPAEPGTTDAERFPHPPYRSDFAEESNQATDYAPGSIRWREPWLIDDVVLSEGTIVSVGGGIEISDGAGSDHAYDGNSIFVSGSQSGDVVSYDHTTSIVGVSGSFDPALAPGDPYKIIKTRPRWSQSSLIIPRTFSDAWSRLPQGAWVRNTDDPPSDDSDPNWWDPDTTPADIAAIQDDDHFPRGGPWGSALWVMVQARFNPVGALWFRYEFNYQDADVCSGHGGDEEEEVETTVTHVTSVQGLAYTGESPFARAISSTDFDAIQCTCGCC